MADYYTVCIVALIAFSCLAVMGDNNLPASTISTAPALLPGPTSPAASPTAMSPDSYPVFPSPGGSELAPSDSSTPLIPSSPSPPNPDEVGGLGPALSPEGVLPDSSSEGRHAVVVLSLMVVMFGGFLVNGGL